jgi:hypothetical protein
MERLPDRKNSYNEISTDNQRSKDYKGMLSTRAFKSIKAIVVN